jgi:hypothetical protein
MTFSKANRRPALSSATSRATDRLSSNQKVDEAGNVLGFSILKVSALKQEPLELDL